MTHLICRQKVADFAQWKAVFDSHADAHREAGLRLAHVWRNIDDQADVFAVFEVHDLDKARAFVSSAEVPDAQQASGMIGPPDVVFVS